MLGSAAPPSRGALAATGSPGAAARAPLARGSRGPPAVPSATPRALAPGHLPSARLTPFPCREGSEASCPQSDLGGRRQRVPLWLPRTTGDLCRLVVGDDGGGGGLRLVRWRPRIGSRDRCRVPASTTASHPCCQRCVRGSRAAMQTSTPAGSSAKGQATFGACPGRVTPWMLNVALLGCLKSYSIHSMFAGICHKVSP